MKNIDKNLVMIISFLGCLGLSNQLKAQDTKIRGFVDIGASIQDDKLNFEFGEYDLFITSDLNDRISFLGETVFRFDNEEDAHHGFTVGVERVIINYNYSGNHSLLIGKQHTSLNYWNETYHHGRVFFPTVSRPLIFESHFIDLHTTGVALQGLNLGKMKFGYNVMVGNGLGAADIKDNDKYKSIAASVHIKPVDKLQLGAYFYNDIISEGAEIFGIEIDEKINHQLYTGSVAYFGSKYELLAEGTLLNNKSESSGSHQSFASYIYTGVRLKEKWVPYLRVDYLKYQNTESYLGMNNTTSFLTGLRYEINYLMVVKLEYQHSKGDITGSKNKLTVQFAIGF